MKLSRVSVMCRCFPRDGHDFLGRPFCHAAKLHIGMERSVHVEVPEDCRGTGIV